MSRESKTEDLWESLQTDLRSVIRRNPAFAAVDQAEADRSAAGAFPGGPDLRPGDWVEHPTWGRCLVSTIEHFLVYMASKEGRELQLSLDDVTFTPDSMEAGHRVFSMSSE